MARTLTDFVTVWNGSRSINNGYLICIADEPRQPPTREDWSALYPPRQKPHQTLYQRLTEALTAQPMSGAQLRELLQVGDSQIQTALGRLRREGRLHNRKDRNGQRKLVNVYWIEP